MDVRRLTFTDAILAGLIVFSILWGLLRVSTAISLGGGGAALLIALAAARRSHDLRHRL